MSNHETLGSSVVPINYKVKFEPDMSTFKTRGVETVNLQVNDPTDTLILNASELEISSAYVYVAGERVAAQNIELNENNGTVSFHFPNKFSGTVKLHVNFLATNNDKMHGFYRSTYDVNGEKKQMLTSHFEPIDARTAFPCFDEPELKATLDVALRVDNHLSAISNMPKKRERRLEGMLAGKKDVSFQRTPRMSTYLLYLGVGEFEQTVGRSRKTRINVTTTPGKLERAKLPGRYAGSVLRFYEDYFETKFPLPKIDLIAVPDFPMGAMENWGAITFRERLLLCDNKSAQAERQTVASVIAHELAHQWFGNLVTMKWWDDLWLNESFATLMSYKALDKIFPQWKTSLTAIPDMFGSAFAADDLLSTHPVSVEIKRASESNALFDSISYNKGGSLLHMIEDYVGEDNFRAGLRSYIRAHKYSNATKSDLWTALSQTSGAKGTDVKDVVQRWLETPGHPIVYVEKLSDGKFLLRQKRFLRSKDIEGTWPIPVHYLTDKGEGFMLLEKPEQVLELNCDWIKLNYGQHGFYRVGYDPQLLEKLGSVIQDGKLPAIDAWGIESTLFSLARSSRMTTTAYLDFARNLTRLTEYPLVSSVIGSLNWFSYQYRKGEVADDVTRLKKQIASSLLEKLTWSKKDTDTAIDTTLRGQAVFILGKSGDKAALEKVSSLFKAYLSDQNMDPDLRSTVYSVIAARADRTAYNELISRYRSAQDTNEKLRLLGALSMARNPALIREILDFAHSQEVRSQDGIRVIGLAAASPEGLEAFLSWLKSNWTMLKDRYGPGSGLLNRYVEALTPAYTNKQKDEISSFFYDPCNCREDIKPSLDRTLEKIDSTIAYRMANGLA